MLLRARISNFKAFRNQTIELAALTVLSGLNGSGKSSLLQAFLMLRQSWELGDLKRNRLALNGKYVSLGTFRDVLFEGATDDGSIGIAIAETETDAEVRFVIPPSASDQRTCVLETTGSISNNGLWGGAFRFLRAERIGPRVNYEISETGSADIGLGVSGEFAVEFLASQGERHINLAACRHPLAKSDLLKSNVEAWMGEFSPNLRLIANSDAEHDRFLLRYQFEGSLGVSNEYRPTHVGFGVSYTLPVVLAILAAKPGDLLLIESPEAHLHPRGQAKLGELMSLAAQAGVQLLVETHSDHVLNGVRVAVHQRQIEASKVAFLYFQWDPKRSEGATTVQRLTVDSKGRIENWPLGFFDEMDRSLEILLGPQPGE
jgi:predicted ATPase